MENKPTALITGASGGLGRCLSREFAGHGFDLVITARDPVKLQELAVALRRDYGVHVQVAVGDLNQKGAPRQLYDKLTAAGVQVDVLVNNAGFGLGGCFVHNRPRLQEAMVRVNMLAPTQLCRLFLPGMLEQGYGGVLNVCSTGSFVPGPYNSIYCATKAYLLHLSEALAHELRHSPVWVTAVCPGAMHTGFAHRAGMETTRLFNYGVMSPAEVARCAYHSFAMRRRVAVVGPLNRMMVEMVRLLPRSVVARASGAFQRQREVPTSRE